MKCLAPMLLLLSCVPSTGGQLVSFPVFASGPVDANAGQPYQFVTPSGFDVTLSQATLFVGAVYLNQTNPTGYGLEPACVLPDLYTGQMLGALRVDVLNGQPQAFPVEGTGSDALTRAAELWLTSSDINADEDKTVVVETVGIARRALETWPFEARFTIGSNRRLPPRNPSLPGSNPLCKQRIVSPIAVDFQLQQGVAVKLTVDPKAWFQAVNFKALKSEQLSEGVYRFIDDSARAGQPDNALYNGFRAAQGAYQLEPL